MINRYPKGTLVRCSGVFTTVAATIEFIDPDTVSFSFRKPDGTVTTYVYLTDDEIVRDSEGHYHVDLNGNLSGRWHHRFFSTGLGQAAGERSFTILASNL